MVSRDARARADYNNALYKSASQVGDAISHHGVSVEGGLTSGLSAIAVNNCKDNNSH